MSCKVKWTYPLKVARRLGALPKHVGWQPHPLLLVPYNSKQIGVVASVSPRLLHFLSQGTLVDVWRFNEDVVMFDIVQNKPLPFPQEQPSFEGAEENATGTGGIKVIVLTSDGLLWTLPLSFGRNEPGANIARRKTRAQLKKSPPPPGKKRKEKERHQAESPNQTKYTTEKTTGIRALYETRKGPYAPLQFPGIESLSQRDNEELEVFRAFVCHIGEGASQVVCCMDRTLHDFFVVKSLSSFSGTQNERENVRLLSLSMGTVSTLQRFRTADLAFLELPPTANDTSSARDLVRGANNDPDNGKEAYAHINSSSPRGVESSSKVPQTGKTERPTTLALLVVRSSAWYNFADREETDTKGNLHVNEHFFCSTCACAECPHDTFMSLFRAFGHKRLIPAEGVIIAGNECGAVHMTTLPAEVVADNPDGSITSSESPAYSRQPQGDWFLLSQIGEPVVKIVLANMLKALLVVGKRGTVQVIFGTSKGSTLVEGGKSAKGDSDFGSSEEEEENNQRSDGNPPQEYLLGSKTYSFGLEVDQVAFSQESCILAIVSKGRLFCSDVLINEEEAHVGPTTVGCALPQHALKESVDLYVLPVQPNIRSVAVYTSTLDKQNQYTGIVRLRGDQREQTASPPTHYARGEGGSTKTTSRSNTQGKDVQRKEQSAATTNYGTLSVVVLSNSGRVFEIVCPELSSLMKHTLIQGHYSAPLSAQHDPSVLLNEIERQSALCTALLQTEKRLDEYLLSNSCALRLFAQLRYANNSKAASPAISTNGCRTESQQKQSAALDTTRTTGNSQRRRSKKKRSRTTNKAFPSKPASPLITKSIEHRGERYLPTLPIECTISTRTTQRNTVRLSSRSGIAQPSTEIVFHLRIHDALDALHSSARRFGLSSSAPSSLLSFPAPPQLAEGCWSLVVLVEGACLQAESVPSVSSDTLPTVLNEFLLEKCCKMQSNRGYEEKEDNDSNERQSATTQRCIVVSLPYMGPPEQQQQQKTGREEFFVTVPVDIHSALHRMEGPFQMNVRVYLAYEPHSLRRAALSGGFAGGSPKRDSDIRQCSCLSSVFGSAVLLNRATLDSFSFLSMDRTLLADRRRYLWGRTSWTAVSGETPTVREGTMAMAIGTGGATSAGRRHSLSPSLLVPSPTAQGECSASLINTVTTHTTPECLKRLQLLVSSVPQALPGSRSLSDATEHIRTSSPQGADTDSFVSFSLCLNPLINALLTSGVSASPPSLGCSSWSDTLHLSSGVFQRNELRLLFMLLLGPTLSSTQTIGYDNLEEERPANLAETLFRQMENQQKRHRSVQHASETPCRISFSTIEGTRASVTLHWNMEKCRKDSESKARDTKTSAGATPLLLLTVSAGNIRAGASLRASMLNRAIALLTRAIDAQAPLEHDATSGSERPKKRKKSVPGPENKEKEENSLKHYMYSVAQRLPSRYYGTMGEESKAEMEASLRRLEDKLALLVSLLRKKGYAGPTVSWPLVNQKVVSLVREAAQLYTQTRTNIDAACCLLSST